MINYSEALQILKESASKSEISEVVVNKASGLVAAEDINSKIDIPSFNNSAMDGFAFISSKC